MPVRLAALDLYQQAFTDLDCFEKAGDEQTSHHFTPTFG